MLSPDQLLSALFSAFLLWIGVKAIRDRALTYSKERDDDDAPSGLVTGWLAVVLGCIAIAGAGYFCAGALGLVAIRWE